MSASAALAVLLEVEQQGGRIERIARGVRVTPPGLVTPELVVRLRAVGRDLLALLRRRAAPSSPRASCELRRFPEWRSSAAVRFCAEPSHAHADGIPTYSAEELGVVLEWCRRTGVRRLPVPLRDALLELKSRFGGRIDPSTLRAEDAAQVAT